MYELLRNKASGLMRQATTCLSELIQIPSISGNESEVARATEQAFRRFGFDQVLVDEFGNVVGTILGREKGPVVLLLTHLDTVSPGEHKAWQYDPWSGQVSEGKVHGLGAVDCKGGVVTQLFAAALLKRALLPFEGSIVVAATVSEENGRSLGARALLDHTLPSLDLSPTYAILGEPTHNGIYYGHDGWTEVRLEICGANPFQVSDAANAIYDDLAITQAGAQHLVGTETFAISAPVRSDSAGMRHAQINVARRLSVGDSAEQVVGQIRHAAEMVAHDRSAVALDVRPRQIERTLGKLQTRVECVVDAWSTDPFSPLVDRARQALAAANLEVRAGTWKLGRLGSGTAGSTLVRHYGIPTIGYGPGDEALAHGPNECMEIAQLQEGIIGTAVIVHALAGVPTFGWTAEDP
jgi:putative selenium metabolism hydrolase